MNKLVSTESEILQSIKLNSADYLKYIEFRDTIPNYDLKSIQANPLTIEFMKDQTVELCLLAIDQNLEIINHIHIVNGEKEDDHIYATLVIDRLIKKQELLDSLSGVKDLDRIISHMSKNLIHLKNKTSSL